MRGRRRCGGMWKGDPRICPVSIPEARIGLHLAAKFEWANAGLLLKDLLEVFHIRVSTGLGDLAYALRRMRQHALCMRGADAFP